MPSEKRARQRAAREARLIAQAKAAQRRKQIRNAIIAVVVAGVVVGIVFLVSGSNKPVSNLSGNAAGTTTTTSSTTSTTKPTSNAKLQSEANALAVKAGCPASTSTRVNTQTYPAAPAMTIDTNKLYSATVQTTAGTFIMALDAKSAPITTNNFVFLAQKGYFHCVIFHRVIPQFMDQTGDPTGKGTGGPGYTITDENPPKAANPADQYPLGSVAMANTGSPNSGGSQWFVVSGPQGESLPNSYTLFGRVITGINVVEKINQEGSAAGVPPDVTQRILSVTIQEAAGS